MSAVDEVDVAAARFRDAGRAAMGVDGVGGAGFWRELRRHRLSVYTLVALGLLAIVDTFQQVGFVVMAPDIARGLGVSRTVVALLVVITGVAETLAALPMAAVVESRPRRATVAKATAMVWSVATLFTGFATGPMFLAFVLMLDGATSGSVDAVHQPLLIDTYPTSVRARVMSGYQAFFTTSAVLAPLLVAVLAGPLELTWRGVFVVMGCLSVLAALAGLWLRDPGFGRWDAAKLRAAVRGESQQSDEPSRPDADEYRLHFFEILRRLLLIPTARRVIAVLVCIGILQVPLNTYFVFFLEEHWGLDAAARGLFFAVVPVFGIAAVLLFSRHNEKLFHANPARLYRFAAILVTAGILLIGAALFSPVFALMVAAFGLEIACFSVANVVLLTGFFSILRPQMRPHASALAGLFQTGVGGFVGLVLLSGLDQRYGISGAILSICAPGLLAALLLRHAARSINADLDRTVAELVEEEELESLGARGVRLPMLACRHVDFSYGQVQVLFGVDFSVDDGEMVALLGTNGAGKSTLLRVVSGLGLPSRGSVRFRGGDITFLGAERRVRLGISQIPGGRSVYGPLSVVENLRVQGFAHGRSRREIDRGIESAFATFPRLAERRNVPAATLSGGEQQMLGLSKALIMRPRLFLIDELSLGLAPRIVGELLEMVRAINAQGTAVVLVEQSVNIALALVQHAYFMEKGEIRFDGAADELAARGDLLRSVFLEGAGKGFAASPEGGGPAGLAQSPAPARG